MEKIRGLVGWRLQRIISAYGQLRLAFPVRTMRTENSTKKMYSTTHFPPTGPMPSALPQGCQSWHSESSEYPQQQKLLFR